MRYHEIIQLDELRKNPEQNPKDTPLLRIYHKMKESDSEVYVSMTWVDKLGINPTSRYNTPIGIYAYPAEYVIDAVTMDGSLAWLPFAGDNEYVNLFTATGNIVPVNRITEDELPTYYKQLTNGYLKMQGINSNSNEGRTAIDTVNRFIDLAPTNAMRRIPGGYYWYVSMMLAKSFENKSTPVMWNKLFRSSGVDGLHDRGAGIIHTAEHIQAVFFSTTIIRDVERLYNRHADPDKWQGREKGQSIIAIKRDIKGKSDEELVNMVRDNIDVFEYIKNPSENVQIAFVSQEPEERDDPKYIHRIKNPSENVQLASVKNNPSSIYYIEHPTEKVQLTAISLNSDVIFVFKDKGFSEKMQLAIIAIDPGNILPLMQINNATEKVQIAAIKAEPKVLDWYYTTFSDEMKAKYGTKKGKV